MNRVVEVYREIIGNHDAGRFLVSCALASSFFRQYLIIRTAAGPVLQLATAAHNAPRTMNISLPDEMRAFIEEQMTREGYASASEYVRDLIREAERRMRQAGTRSQACGRPARSADQDDTQGLAKH